ncbi:ubiquinone biosynthesis protein COQ9, mitochondrial [Ischnura elegans]|uniref:ubiquinone biosynthesis protein COQ9, mitochondrial n=1 Tax=Ischnura elegans TaxID=197161 RepID=UPI001ED88A5B|nr:ubiquinone biosynthesis protein COQ9, mitochondrial [Ischnura elegans]
MAISMLFKCITLSRRSVFQGKAQERLRRALSSSSNSDSKSNAEDKDQSCKVDTKDVKKKIMEASLPYVNIHGWTKVAISAGAESIGYPGVAHGLFPGGGVELVNFFYTSCNHDLAERLKQEVEEARTDPLMKRKPPKFARDAVETRLRMIIPYIKHWPQAIAIMTMPQNVPVSLANLLTLVDDICYYAGDNSVDFSWYTKRIALAGVYKVTELSLIQDTSEDYEATWRFLDRRMEDVTQLQSYLKKSGDFGAMAQETAMATFITARNILGLNR